MDKTAIKFSVVICTYNPIKGIFNKCLDGITAASAFLEPYEILIIDNNSAEPVESRRYVRDFLEKNKNTKVITELNQGLTTARLRAIKESSGELIIFVDDDNFIPEDFFLKGVEIARQNPLIGAFSGQVILEFEEKPEDWTKKYWGLLV